MDHHSLDELDELDDAQQQAAMMARRRIEEAEEHVDHYRSQIFRIQEGFHQHAAQRDVVDDPAFRAALQHVSEDADENIRTASQAIAELEEDLQAMTVRHIDEREDFLARQRQD